MQSCCIKFKEEISLNQDKYTFIMKILFYNSFCCFKLKMVPGSTKNSSDFMSDNIHPQYSQSHYHQKQPVSHPFYLAVPAISLYSDCHSLRFVPVRRIYHLNYRFSEDNNQKRHYLNQLHAPQDIRRPVYITGSRTYFLRLPL